MLGIWVGCVQVELESHRGWKVLQADTGISGLAAAKEEHPELILLDVTTHEMDGITALQELQQDEAIRHIPVIMLTALAGDSDRRIYGELGPPGSAPNPTISRRYRIR